MKYSNCGRNSMKLSRHIETICSKMKNVSICYRSDPHASYPKVPVCPGGTPSYVGCCKSFTHQPSEKWWSESQLGWWHSIPHFFLGKQKKSSHVPVTTSHVQSPMVGGFATGSGPQDGDPDSGVITIGQWRFYGHWIEWDFHRFP